MANVKKDIKCCPIQVALNHIGKKWAINIIRDLFMGKKRFSDFLEANPELSTRMLSLRLQELEKEGVIEKKVVSKTPLKVEYVLTKKGKGLDRVLYELSRYSMMHYSGEVFKKGKSNCCEKYLNMSKKMFCCKK